MKSKLLFAVLFVLLFSSFNTAFAKDNRTEEEIIKSRESYTKVVTVLGKQYLLFAQNSPEWDELIADESKQSYRQFGDSGCIVCAFANATVNALNYNDLSKIRDISRSDFYIDTIALTRNRGKYRGRFLIESDADYLRYWPLVCGNYAAGNNLVNEKKPMSPAWYHQILRHYGIEYKVTRDYMEGINALNNGAMVITCSSGSGSPFSRVGHFITIVGRDENYLYILDSYVRDSFPRDKNHIIEVLEPGVLRIKTSNWLNLMQETQYIIYPKDNATVYDAERLDNIVNESNRSIEKRIEE